MRVNHNGKEFKLQGDDAWNDKRFESLKGMNPRGKVVIIEVREGRELDKYLVPIGELTIRDEARHY